MNDTVRRLIGFVVGTALGIAVFWVALSYDVHVLGAVGACAALGIGIAAKRVRPVWSILAAVLAVSVSVVVEWWFRPFEADASLRFFLSHVADLPRHTLLQLLAALLMGLWFGAGRSRWRAAEGDDES